MPELFIAVILFGVMVQLAWIGYWIARGVLTITDTFGQYGGFPVWRSFPYMALGVTFFVLLLTSIDGC